jgi:hypothetical protein
MKNYEEIVYNFFPDKIRIDSFFDKHRNMYEYKLHEMSENLIRKIES